MGEGKSETDGTAVDAGGSNGRWLAAIIGTPVSVTRSYPPPPPGLRGTAAPAPPEKTGADSPAAVEPPPPAAPKPAAEPATAESAPEPATAKPTQEPAAPRPRKIPRAAVEAVHLDLDISLGIDDPALLATIEVTFAGLPDGVHMSKGAAAGPGAWRVAGNDLDGVALVLPAGTRDFELTVSTDFGDGDVQSAVLPVETGAAFAGVTDDPDETFVIKLAAGGAGAHRLKVHVDGVAVCDREVQWRPGDAVLRELTVGYDGRDGLPFEILIRCTPTSPDDDAGPAFVGLHLDEFDIGADAPAVKAKRTADGALGGFRWAGDLIVDVRRAVAGEPQVAFEATVEAVDTSSGEPAIEPIPTEPVEESPATEPVESVTTAQSAPSDEPPDATPEEAAPAAGQGRRLPVILAPADVLFVEASHEELRRPAFLAELRQLRDFIRSHWEKGGAATYDRLGIETGKWRDMIVRGPAGRPVDLDPMLPAYAPSGGVANAQRVASISQPGGGDIVVSGLPAGTLLSRGKNLGGGSWRLPGGNDGILAVLPLGHGRIVPVDLTSPDGGAEEALLLSPRPESPILSGRPAFRKYPLPLPADVFDPDGLGRLTLTVADVPPGVLLSRGLNHGAGVWTVETVADRPPVVVAPASAAFTIAVTCVAMNEETGGSTIISRRFAVSGKGVAALRPAAA